MEVLFAFVFMIWIALCLVWAAMFTQPGRVFFAKRGYRFRRVRWTSAIAATITFFLLGIVAQGLPPDKDAATKPLEAGAAGAAPSAAAAPADEATSSTLGVAPAPETKAESEPKYTHLKGGYIACISKDLFDQFIHNQAIDKNPQATDYLLRNGCVVTGANVRVSIVDSSLFGGWVEFRSYTNDGQPFDAWTNFENVITGTE